MRLRFWRITSISRKQNIRCADTPFVESRGWFVYAERIMTPLSDDDTVNMVFIYALWTVAPENNGERVTP
jgi:hypothetical protein